MEGKQVFAPDKEEHQQTVIVDVSAGGTARIRKAPPDVLVMVVEGKEISPHRKCLLAAGGGGQMLAPDANATSRPTPRQIPVSFPG